MLNHLSHSPLKSCSSLRHFVTEIVKLFSSYVSLRSNFKLLVCCLSSGFQCFHIIVTENICTDFIVFLFFPSTFFLQDGKTEKSDGATSLSGKTTMKSVLENLGELWDQEQYDSEYSLERFMHSLK